MISAVTKRALGLRAGKWLAVAVVAAAPAVGLAQQSDKAAPAHPNIIMVYVDDMGYADISSFATKPLDVKTPHIDKMASEGTKFYQYYSAMPICSPSRAAVLSGMFAAETGLTSYLQTREGNYENDQNDYFDPALAFLPKSFKAAGYATAHVGKWHMGGGRDVDNAPSMGKYGYDEFYGTWESPDRDPKLGTIHAPWDRRLVPGQVERHERTEYMVDKTLDFFQRNEGKPRFVTLWLDDMHTPFWPSPEMLEKYGGDLERDNSIANFYGVLEEMDKQIGRLIEGLKTQGIDNETIVFLTGDNGPAPHYEHRRNDGMRGMKLSLYEGGIRQPFIIRWPGKVPAQKENRETVLCAVDLLPSLTAMAGIPMVPEAEGKAVGEDLSAALLGETPKRTKPILWEYGRNAAPPRPKAPEDRSPSLGIRSGDFKLLVDDGMRNAELYNVVKDPYEKTNLADKRTTMVRELGHQVINWSRTLPHRTHPYPAE